MSTIDEDDDGWGRPRPRFEHIFSPQNDPQYLFPGEEDKASNEVKDNDNMDIESKTEQSPNNKNKLYDHVLPGCDGVPKAELSHYYISVKEFSVERARKELDQAYTSWMTLIPGETQPKHTCIFTCPISNEKFASGSWRNDRGVWNDGHIFFYQTKKDAINAAAARALDCFSLRKCFDTDRIPSQRCQDEAYLEGNAPALPPLPKGVTLPEMQQQERTKRAITAPMTPAKGALNQWAEKVGRKLVAMGEIPVIEERFASKNYSTWTNYMIDTTTRRFTAVFTCPWTGERFASGKLVGSEGNYTEVENVFLLRLSPGGNRFEAEVRTKENMDGAPEGAERVEVKLVWYKSKKEAETAAAGRAMDCILYREKNGQYPLGHEETSRYCLEEPYTEDEIPVYWKEISNSVSHVVDIDWKNSHSGRKVLVERKSVLPKDRRFPTNNKDADADGAAWSHAWKKMRRPVRE